MSRIKDRIVELQGCPEKMAVEIEKNLLEISMELRPLLERWLDVGEASDSTEYGGYSLDSLMKDYDMKFTGAILTLDWLIREPEEAGKALKEGIR